MLGHRVTEAKLFKLLKKREAKDGFEAAEISSQVAHVVAEAWPLLQHVCRSFPQYTLHDPDHSFRVAQNMSRLIPENTVANLNSVELSILLLAAYLHDIGMAASQEEFYAWLESAEYHSFLGTHDKWAQALRAIEWGPDFEHFRHFKDIRDFERFDDFEHYRIRKRRMRSRDVNTENADAQTLDLRRLQDVMYTEFLRESHAARGAAFIIERFGPSGTSDHKIRIGEVNYADQVALVCKSHWDAALSLKADKYRRDGYIGMLPVNLQYCAIILRLADLIELDPERTPKVLMDFILLDLENQGDREGAAEQARLKSGEEWAKHRAILGYKISPDEIRIEAKCSHPAIQRGLREWCDYIDRERQDCRLVVHENRRDISDHYHLRLDTEVRANYIESDGSYLYSDFKFQLDYERIVELLMGTELWGDPAVVLRELLQNAIDACHHRAAMCREQGRPYTPRILFRLHPAHEVPFGVTLTCEDNGTGMDKRIVETFLMRIGRSYYQSSEFRRQNLPFYPISHFGLGVMSCFMIAGKVKIETQRYSDSAEVSAPLLVEITASGRYVVMRPLTKSREGTAVVLDIDHATASHFGPYQMDREYLIHSRMRGHSPGPWFFGDQVSSILQRLAVHLDIPVEFEGPPGKTVIQVGGYELPAIDWSRLLCMKARHREFIFNFTYEETGGLAGIFRFLLPLTDTGDLCLGCAVESLFKLFIDIDGDLCLATPSYTDKRMNLQFGINEVWRDSESRGVYRHKFNQKPPHGSEHDYDSGSDLLEVVKASFRWSQDGLYVGPLTFKCPDVKEKKDDSDKKKPDEPNVFTDLQVPGLNAADIDIRGPWRVSLNVQRSDFQGGAALENFRQRYYALAAEMWKRILTTPGLFSTVAAWDSFVTALLQRASWPLESYLRPIVDSLPELRVTEQA